MKANELRFGNLVDYYGEVVTINSIDDMDVGFSDYVTFDYPSLEEINPIPLTEEWLVRFGFVKMPNGVDFGIRRYFVHKRYEKYEICQGIERTSFSNPFEYVHQLQNLYFALTGEELTLRP